MIEDVPTKQEEGQLEFNFFNKDDWEPGDIDIEAIGMYEGESNTSHEDIRYCNMMTIDRPPFLETVYVLKEWTKPYLEVSCQVLATNMLLDTGADLSFITLDLLKIIGDIWASDMNISNLDMYFYRTVNSELQIREKIEIPITIKHVTQTCTLLINFAVI